MNTLEQRTEEKLKKSRQSIRDAAAELASDSAHIPMIEAILIKHILSTIDFSPEPFRPRGLSLIQAFKLIVGKLSFASKQPRA